MQQSRFAALTSVLLLTAFACPAQANDNFLNKTFVVSAVLSQERTPFQFYIARDGRIFSYSNNSGDCTDTGAVGKINGTGSSGYTCPMLSGNGTFTVNTTTTSSVAGNTIRITQNQSTHSKSTGTSRGNYTFSWQFDGKNCGHASYAYRSATYSVKGKDVKCTWKNGR